MIELDEGFEGDAEALAIIEQGAVMIRNSPRPRIEIKAFLEAAGLRRAAEFCKSVATAGCVQFRPLRAAVGLQRLNLLASRAATSSAAVMPARPAPSTSTDAPLGSPLKLNRGACIELDAKPGWSMAALHRSAAGDRTHKRQKIAAAWNWSHFHSAWPSLVPRDALRRALLRFNRSDWLSHAPAYRLPDTSLPSLAIRPSTSASPPSAINTFQRSDAPLICS